MDAPCWGWEKLELNEWLGDENCELELEVYIIYNKAAFLFLENDNGSGSNATYSQILQNSLSHRVEWESLILIAIIQFYYYFSKQT